MHYEDYCMVYFMKEFYTVDVGAFFYELGHTPYILFYEARLEWHGLLNYTLTIHLLYIILFIL